MPVDESGDQPQAVKVAGMRRRMFGSALADLQDAPAANQDVLYAQVLGRKYAGIFQKLKHWKSQRKKGRYITLPLHFPSDQSAANG